MQAPQPTHLSLSSCQSSRSASMAPSGHSFSQALQYIHSAASNSGYTGSAGAAGATSGAAPKERLFLGHLSIHAPHLTHVSSSTSHVFAFLSTLRASTGHAFAQSPQNTHSSLLHARSASAVQKGRWANGSF